MCSRLQKLAVPTYSSRVAEIPPLMSAERAGCRGPRPGTFSPGAISRSRPPSFWKAQLSRWALRINGSIKMHSSARSMRSHAGEAESPIGGLGWKVTYAVEDMWGLVEANGVWVSNLGGHDRGMGMAGRWISGFRGGLQDTEGYRRPCRDGNAFNNQSFTCLQTARADSTSSQIEPSLEGIGAELILKPYSRLGGTHV